MAINLSDNVHVSAPKPVESKYLNITVPYTGTSQVNTCIASGERYLGLTVNISNVEYWYKMGVLDACLVTKSAGGTWGSITGTLSLQTDLQTCLNGKLASGGTAICATTAGNALALCGCVPTCFLGATACAADSAKLNNKSASFYLNTGSTISCATNASTVGGCTPSCFLGVNATAVCATCAIGAKNLCGCVPASFLLSGGTAICATCAIGAKNLCGCVPASFLLSGGTAVCSTCAIGAKALCGCVPASFLLSGGTAVCATCAIGAKNLCGCVPSCFLGATATASDSSKLGGQLPAYYLNTGSTITCAADSAKLNNKLPAYYLNTGSTALCATCAIGAKNLCGCVPASFLLSGDTAVCATSAIDSKGLCGCTPSCFLGATACATDSAKLNNKLPAYYLNTGSTSINSLALCGCVPSCFLGATATALCAGTAGNALALCNCTPSCFLGTTACASDSAKLGGVLPAGYLLSGGTAICSTSSIDSKALCGCTPACFLGVNATAVCATCAIGAKNLCGCVPASFLLSGGTAVCSTSSVDSKALCGCIPTCFLGATATATNSLGLCGCTPACFLGVNACAADSNKLNNHLVGYFLNTGSTIALATCSTTAGNALCLNGHPQAYYLLSGGTAVCATCAGNASTVAGCTPSCFLGATACATDSAKLNNKLPAYYLNTGSTITCASDSAKLNNKLPAYYLNTGSTIALATCATTAGNALCLNGHTEAALSVCNSVCVNGHAEANLSVANSACLGGHLPAYFLTSGGTALCATTAGNALCLGGVLPAGYLLSGGTAKNSLCLNGHLEAALSVCNSVCVNGHAESALSVANAACLGGNLANTYAPKLSPVLGCLVTINECAFYTAPTLGSACGSLILNSSNCLNGLAVGVSSNGDTWFQSQRFDASTAVYNIILQGCGGNVGIGIASPGNKLHILGSNPSYGFLKLQSTTTGEASINYKDCNGTDELAWTVGKGAGGIGDAFGWYWNGVDRMQLSTAGVLCAATCGISLDWVATSDCRLKTCIKPIMGALSTVMCLQGVCYELCDDGKHLNQLGLLAQDVQPILPAIVSHSQPSEADAKYGITDEKLGISYGKISVILIEAIKEQQKQIEENKKQIRALCLELNYMRNYNK